jgi:tRNA G18 (ribose-2'-O)-methylase SpoU
MGRQKKGDTETNFEVRSFDARMAQEDYRRLPKNGLYIILDNLRSAFNVGSIFRLCDALRVGGLFLCGYTAHPPHVKLEKTSLGTVGYVPWKHFGSTVDALRHCALHRIPVWACETTSVSVPYHSVRYPSPVAIVFGNEALGVSREVLESCERIIELPMAGFKNSVNVAASVAVVGYEILRGGNKKAPA